MRPHMSARTHTHIRNNKHFSTYDWSEKGAQKKAFFMPCKIKTCEVQRSQQKTSIYILCLYFGWTVKMKFGGIHIDAPHTKWQRKLDWYSHTHTDWMEHKLRCFESVFHLLLTKIRSVWHWTWLYQSITTEDNNIKRRKKKQQIWWIFEVCCVVFFSFIRQWKYSSVRYTRSVEYVRYGSMYTVFFSSSLFYLWDQLIWNQKTVFSTQYRR